VPVDGPQYPVNLVLTGRRCLVVGGGSIAKRKIEGLLACEALVHVIAPMISEAIREHPGLTWEARPYRSTDVEGYRLVITATDDPAVNAQVFRDADAAGVWVNSADDPANCSFTLPAIVRQGPIMVTLATGGHSPALATWLKAHVADQLGPEYEVAAQLLSAERDAIRSAGGSTEGLDWQSALDSDMLDLIRTGQISAARERLKACLSSS